MYVNNIQRERERERVFKTENVCLQQCTFARQLLLRLSWLFPTNKQFKFVVQMVYNVNIPPLFHDNMYVADSNEKATILNKYFVQQTV